MEEFTKRDLQGLFDEIYYIDEDTFKTFEKEDFLEQFRAIGVSVALGKAGEIILPSKFKSEERDISAEAQEIEVCLRALEEETDPGKMVELSRRIKEEWVRLTNRLNRLIDKWD